MTAACTSTTRSRGLGDEALDVLFLEARTHHAWTDEAVDRETLEKLWSIVRWAPTSFNCNPMRLVFVVSDEGKERLLPHVNPNNREKVSTAPCCVVVAYDSKFYEEIHRLVPIMDLRPLFRDSPEVAADTAFRNAGLQGGYLILAARALGLDVGGLSGFDNAGVDREFFPDGRWKSNFLLNLGYGSGEKLRPRGPRLEFAEACRIA